MAILHIVDPPIHPGGMRGTYAHLKFALDYILNPQKTCDGRYAGSINCGCETALKEMIETKRQYGKEPVPGTEGYETDRLAYHFVISWSPAEQAAPDQALEIAKEFCKEYLPEYEAVFAAHTDTAHMHAHIIFNSVNFKDGHKYRYEKNDWEKKLQPLIDRLCRERGLHTLEEDIGRTFAECAKERSKKVRHPDSMTGCYEKHGRYGRREKKEGYSMYDYLRETLDMLVMECRDLSELEQRLKEEGYAVKHGTSEKWGRTMAVRNPEMQRFCRTQTLGSDYTPHMLAKRMEAMHHLLPDSPSADTPECWMFTTRIFRCKIYLIDNPYLRRQYARLYRLGIIPAHGKRPSYGQLKRRRKELRIVEYQLALLADGNYQKPQDFDSGIRAAEEEMEALKKQAGLLKEEKRPYEKMLEILEEQEKAAGDFLLYEEGDERFKEGAERYMELREQTERFPATIEEIKAYLDRQARQLSEVRQKLSRKKEEREGLLELKEDYQRITEIYAPADEKMIDKLKEYGAEEEKIKERKKER